MYVVIGFALATAAIVAGILVAPAISSCSGKADQPFLSCVAKTAFGQQDDTPKLADNGQPASAQTEAGTPTEQSAQTVKPVSADEAPPQEEVAQQEAVSVENTPAATQQEETPLSVEPDFTIARAAADGLVVIVGTAAVDDTIVIKSNGNILGKTKPERTGEWVFVPDNPMPTGGVEITVEAHNAKGEITRFAKSEIVLIHEGRDKEPIVIASTPGEASAIIQGLEQENTQVAAVESKTELAESTSQPTAVSASNDSSNSPNEATPAQNPAPIEVAQADAPEADMAKPTDENTAVALADETLPQKDAEMQGEKEKKLPAEGESSDAQMADTKADEPPVTTSETDNNPDATQDDASSVSANEKSSMAARESEKDKVDRAEPAVELAENFIQPSIDAIEIDGVLNFIAGAGPNGGIMRVYVDNIFVGDAKVQDGRWLIETANVLKDGTQRVRADLIGADNSVVAARAEVNFVLDLPKAIEVAEAPETTPQPSDQSTKIAEPKPASDETEEAKPEDQSVEMAKPETKPEMAEKQQPEAERKDAMKATGETAEEKTVVAMADKPEAMQKDSKKPMLKAETEAAAPAQKDMVTAEKTEQELAPMAAADAVTNTEKVESASEQSALSDSAKTQNSDEKQVMDKPMLKPADTQPSPQTATAPAANNTQESTVEDAGDQDIATITAVAVGEGEKQRFVSGKAIIRHGDNLWTIAHRVYGSGYKYTTIYEANNSQISDPDLIFPGQVFDLPQEAEQE